MIPYGFRFELLDGRVHLQREVPTGRLTENTTWRAATVPDLQDFFAELAKLVYPPAPPRVSNGWPAPSTLPCGCAHWQPTATPGVFNFTYCSRHIP